MNSKYLLTIAIPTFNRSTYLQETLLNITSDPAFTKNVQIVISDNCSTDNTEAVVSSFIRKYDNVYYFKNNENIEDKNFIVAIQRSDGLYVKLHNDTVHFKKGALGYIVSTVQEHSEDQKPLFFYNRDQTEKKTVYDLNTFLLNASYEMTWIANFGTWKSAFLSHVDTTRFIDTKLYQVDWTLSLVSKNDKAIIIKHDLYETVQIKNKGNYNLFKVFVSDYFMILESYQRENFFSKKALDIEKKSIFLSFLLFWIKALCFSHNKSGYSFQIDGWYLKLLPHYWNRIYFHNNLITLYLKELKILKRIKSFLRRILQVFIK